MTSLTPLNSFSNESIYHVFIYTRNRFPFNLNYTMKSFSHIYHSYTASIGIIVFLFNFITKNNMTNI